MQYSMLFQVIVISKDSWAEFTLKLRTFDSCHDSWLTKRSLQSVTVLEVDRFRTTNDN